MKLTILLIILCFCFYILFTMGCTQISNSRYKGQLTTWDGTIVNFSNAIIHCMEDGLFDYAAEVRIEEPRINHEFYWKDIRTISFTAQTEQPIKTLKRP